jgi:hypothetical protein
MIREYTTMIAEKLQGCCAARMTYGAPAHPSPLASERAVLDRWALPSFSPSLTLVYSL